MNRFTFIIYSILPALLPFTSVRAVGEKTVILEPMKHTERYAGSETEKIPAAQVEKSAAGKVIGKKDALATQKAGEPPRTRDYAGVYAASFNEYINVGVSDFFMVLLLHDGTAWLTSARQGTYAGLVRRNGRLAEGAVKEDQKFIGRGNWKPSPNMGASFTIHDAVFSEDRRSGGEGEGVVVRTLPQPLRFEVIGSSVLHPVNLRDITAKDGALSLFYMDNMMLARWKYESLTPDEDAQASKDLLVAFNEAKAEANAAQRGSGSVSSKNAEKLPQTNALPQVSSEYSTRMTDETDTLVRMASPKPVPESSPNTTGRAEAASRKIFKDGEGCELDGTLSIERDENETWFAITLATPIRVASADGGDPVSVQTLQIAGLDQSGWKKAQGLVGKPVHVIGSLMEAHTRYHHTSVLIIATSMNSPVK